ncbi:MAG: surface-adhesin E family protein [Thermodesulfobacteriota bacterium]
MYRILLQFLILFTNFFLICNYSLASDWKYLGYANVENDEIFYVFIDVKSSSISNNEKIIIEKHVFNNLQIQNEENNYASVEIERLINCYEKRISNLKVTVFNANGNAVNTYIQRDKDIFTEILNEDDVNYSIYREFCI